MASQRIPENFVRRIPDDDEHERLICSNCDFIHYENPRIIVGSVVTHEGKYLMCKRAIEPRLGYWTLPAGFMELGETAAEGAAREAWEEARAKIAIDGLLAVYDVPHVGQVQLMYRATLAEPGFEAGPESLDVKLYDWDSIPWEELAFSTVRWALEAHRDAGGGLLGAPDANAERTPGRAPD